MSNQEKQYADKFSRYFFFWRKKTCTLFSQEGRVGAVKFYPQEQTPGWLLKNKPNPKYPRKKYFVIKKKKSVIYIFLPQALVLKIETTTLTNRHISKMPL